MSDKNINQAPHNPTEPLSPAEEVSVFESQFSDISPVQSEVLLGSEIASVEVDEERFSLKSLAKYLNPVEAAKGYGRFIKRTFQNFALSEVNGTITAMAAAYAANKFGNDAGGWLPALSGTMGENVGFHGTNATKKYRELRRLPEHPYKRREALSETGRYMLSSFALAEVVDTPARTGSMWLVPAIFSRGENGIDPTISLFGGKILADHIYYGIVDPSVAAYNRHAAKRQIKRAAKQAIANSPYAS